jgi:hypothetical protein
MPATVCYSVFSFIATTIEIAEIPQTSGTNTTQAVIQSAEDVADDRAEKH